ncbi:MAG: Jag family protein, partial [Desulfobulbales bacterium]
GKDVAEAISKACKTLNVSQENLDIEVLTTGTVGIFGLCRQKARLRVAVKKEEIGKVEAKHIKQPARSKGAKDKAGEKEREIPAKEKKKGAKSKLAPQEAEVRKEESADFVVDANLLADLKNDLERILALMHYPSSVSVSNDRENVTVQIQGEFVNEIIEQNGRVLDSLQYILRKISSKKYSEKVIISLDAGNFRAARNEELHQLGLKLGAEVKKSGKTRSIPSLNPSERRIVHLALQDDKDVRSRSVGEGLFKKVLIYPAGAKGRRGPGKKRKGDKNKK